MYIYIYDYCLTLVLYLMKKSLILLSTLSLFAIGCNKESINFNNTPESETTEMNLISSTSTSYIDLSTNESFMKLIESEEEVHAIFRN